MTVSVLQPAAGNFCAKPRRTHKQRAIGYQARTAATHRLVYSLLHAEQHDKPGHPEAAARTRAIEQALAQQSFQQQLDLVSGSSTDAQAVMRSLELVHPAGYLRRVQEICSSLQVRCAALHLMHVKV